MAPTQATRAIPLAPRALRCQRRATLALQHYSNIALQQYYSGISDFATGLGVYSLQQLGELGALDTLSPTYVLASSPTLCHGSAAVQRFSRRSRAGLPNACQRPCNFPSPRASTAGMQIIHTVPSIALIPNQGQWHVRSSATALPTGSPPKTTTTSDTTQRTILKALPGQLHSRGHAQPAPLRSAAVQLGCCTKLRSKSCAAKVEQL